MNNHPLSQFKINEFGAIVTSHIMRGPNQTNKARADALDSRYIDLYTF